MTDYTLTSPSDEPGINLNTNMSNDIPQKTETKSERLEREIERLYKFIADEEKVIERAKQNIFWDKKRLKLAKEELIELKESSGETARKIEKE